MNRDQALDKAKALVTGIEQKTMAMLMIIMKG